MTDYISGGALWIGNGTHYLKCKCDNIIWTVIMNPEIEHVSGGVNFGWDLGTYYVIIKALGVWIEANADVDDLQAYLKSWQQAGTIEVEVIRNSSNDKQKLDGTNTKFPCHIVGGIKEAQKKSPGDQEYYWIKEITFEQSGVAS